MFQGLGFIMNRSFWKDAVRNFSANGIKCMNLGFLITRMKTLLKTIVLHTK